MADRRPRRLTDREWSAIACALARCLAGEPETEEEDVDAMASALEKVFERPLPPLVEVGIRLSSHDAPRQSNG